jgi:hypothetical protein
MTRVLALLSRLVLPALAIAALWGLFRAVEFDLQSYAAWTGLLLGLVALVALVRPAAWLWLPTRKRALLALLAGAAVVAAALAWPPALRRSAGPHQRLDDFLPEYQAVEHHEARTRAPIDRVVAAVHEVGLADMPAAKVLIQLRSLADGPLKRDPRPPADTSLLDVMMQPGSGFLVLDASDPRHPIYGMAGAPWSNAQAPDVHDAAAFRAYADPGNVRVAFDFQMVEEPGGVVRISTETRILGTDAAARQTFARYWRLVYPGSAIIRRVWLDAIVRRAERGPS